MLFDEFADSAFGLPFVCAILACLVVSAGYMSPYMNGLAIPALASAKFPLKSFARSATVVFLPLIIGASLLFAHRFPVGLTLISVGALMLMYLPPDRPEAT
jgi:predicted permease